MKSVSDYCLCVCVVGPSKGWRGYTIPSLDVLNTKNQTVIFLFSGPEESMALEKGSVLHLATGWMSLVPPALTIIKRSVSCQINPLHQHRPNATLKGNPHYKTCAVRKTSECKQHTARTGERKETLWEKPLHAMGL